MNKYIIPICDLDSNRVWIKTIVARSNADCQEKLIEELIELYDIDDNTSNYKEFVKLADTEYNILIGNIKDIEEL